MTRTTGVRHGPVFRNSHTVAPVLAAQTRLLYENEDRSIHQRFTAEQGAFWREAEAFFSSHVDEALRVRTEAGGAEFDEGFHRAIGRDGWIGLQVPTEHGGGGRGFVDGAIVAELGELFGAPMLAPMVASIVSYMISRHGTDALRERWLSGLLDGSVVACLGYSEPEAGSDLGSLTTRAARTADGWELTGTKVFTSLAHVADVALCVARTGEVEARHRSLTMFVVPLDDVVVEPIWTVGGFRTNFTVYDQVVVPDDHRLGDVGEAWQLLMGALDLERAGTARVGQARRILRLLLEEETAGAAIVDRTAEARALVARILAARALAYEVAWRQDADREVTKLAAMSKVAGTELVRDVTQFAMDVLGAPGLLSRGAGSAPCQGEIEHQYRNAVRYTVTAGTNEIMRSLIAQQGLGLPRARG